MIAALLQIIGADTIDLYVSNASFLVPLRVRVRVLMNAHTHSQRDPPGMRRLDEKSRPRKLHHRHSRRRAAHRPGPVQHRCRAVRSRGPPLVPLAPPRRVSQQEHHRAARERAEDDRGARFPRAVAGARGRYQRVANQWRHQARPCRVCGKLGGGQGVSVSSARFFPSFTSSLLLPLVIFLAFSSMLSKESVLGFFLLIFS